MGPLPYGPVTRHVNASNGPDNERAKFYATEYSVSHGKSGFVARPGKHTGTGYQSNFRPGLFYSRRLDEIDNPKLGDELLKNYSSSNSFQFRKSAGPNGTDQLPGKLHMAKNSFVRDLHPTLPCSRQIGETLKINATNKFNKSPASLLKLRSNVRSGLLEDHPKASLATENTTEFEDRIHEQTQLTSKPDIGPKCESGFTNSLSKEPITYREDECYGVQNFCRRPTGISNMRNSFQPLHSADGKEEYIMLSQRAANVNGYTKSMKPRAEYALHRLDTYTKANDLQPTMLRRLQKNDKGEFFNVLYAAPFPSMNSASYTRHPKPDSGPEKRRIGPKEETGFTENNCKFIPTLETGQSLKRFDTHYKARFCNKNLKPVPFTANPGKTTLMQKGNGFSKSTRVHSPIGKRIDVTLPTMHPYVVRSNASRDPSYVN